MVLAQEEARALDHDYIGTEHLLLGLIGENQGCGRSCARNLGADLNVLRRDVIARAGSE